MQGAGVVDCGACGTACDLSHASGATCWLGSCAPNCDAGFRDCNTATLNDGCETAITTAANCGACGYACSPNGATNMYCVSSRCAPACAAGHADCNRIGQLPYDDGCETFLDALDKCRNDCNSAGIACGPTQVCNSGSCVAPSGIAVLSVPFTGAEQSQRFADLFNVTAPNLEGTSLTVRAYAPGATSGTLLIVPSDTASAFSSNVLKIDLTSLSAKWMDLAIPIASAGPFNATSVKQINLTLSAGKGPWSKPTVLYIDSIRSSNLRVNDTFDTSFGNLLKSSLVAAPGATIDWTQSLP